MKEIVIYTQPGIELDVIDNRFSSAKDLDVSSLNKVLRQYKLIPSKLGSRADNDQFNSGQSQQIFILSSNDNDADAILEFLTSENQLIQSAYIKAESEDANENE